MLDSLLFRRYRVFSWDPFLVMTKNGSEYLCADDEAWLLCSDGFRTSIMWLLWYRDCLRDRIDASDRLFAREPPPPLLLKCRFVNEVRLRIRGMLVDQPLCVCVCV